jgi:hypothetical protein
MAKDDFGSAAEVCSAWARAALHTLYYGDSALNWRVDDRPKVFGRELSALDCTP